jgi:hypothetical protein
MDEYIKSSLRGAASKLAVFISTNLIALLGCRSVIALVIIAANWSWEFWGEATYKDGKITEIRIDHARIVQQWLIIGGGLVALLLAMWRTWTAKVQADTSIRQVSISEHGQNIERFVKAVEMLSSASGTQRRAALIALNDIAALDLPTSYLGVMHTLRAFLEEASRQYRRGTGHGLQEVGDAFIVMGRLKSIYDKGGQLLAERRTRPPHLQIDDLYLKAAVTVFTDFSQFIFRNATFDEAGLINSVFTRASFVNCTFHDSAANYSDFGGCYFEDCVFKGERFAQANLAGAHFKNVKFEPGAKLKVCAISGADFTQSPTLEPGNIADCAAMADNPPKFPPRLGIKVRTLTPDDVKMPLDDELRWYAWGGALRNLPPEEAMRRAKVAGIDEKMWPSTFLRF